MSTDATTDPTDPATTPNTGTGATEGRYSGFVVYDAPLGGPPDLSTGPDAARRLARLTELDLIHVDPEWDAFAQRLAESARDLIESTDTPVAMVNFLTDRTQFFAGLYAPAPAVPDSVVAAGPGAGGELPRQMPLDYGGCPHVVANGKALVLDDVCAWRGFWGNPVVDKYGVRSYLGAPLRDRTGTILGTVCVIDQEVRPWGKRGRNLIKDHAATLVERIHDRERHPRLPR
jgi:GAF domain-containing protein